MTYTITRTHGTPNWQSVPALRVENVQWEPDVGIRMEQQLCYDDENLYVRQRAWETAIRMEERESLSQICNDSCMEFFFSPSQDGRYFNFECNPLGCIYLGFGGERRGRLRLISKDPTDTFMIQPQLLSDGWELCYRIPLTFLRLFYPDYAYASGSELWANCYKCGDKTEHPHFLTWSYVESEKPDYHRPQDFSKMIFE